MNVVPFRPRRRPPGPPGPVQPPPALGAVPGPAATETADEDRVRMRQNLAALVAVAGLLLLGVWIIDGVQRYTRTLACIETGHRACTALVLRAQPTPQPDR